MNEGQVGIYCEKAKILTILWDDAMSLLTLVVSFTYFYLTILHIIVLTAPTNPF